MGSDGCGPHPHSLACRHHFSSSAATPPKQWIVALLLAFFVGIFGIHNFYLGYTTKGIIQLILSLTVIGMLVTGIWAFVEFIMIIMRYGAYGCDAQGRPLE